MSQISPIAEEMAARERGIGSRAWAIAEGYIPKDDPSKPREKISHETACILNTNERDANVRIMVYFPDREPVGPFRVTVPARRTFHLRFNELRDPMEIPRGADYSSVIESDVPIVVQHTRLDTTENQKSLLSTIAFPAA